MVAAIEREDYESAFELLLEQIGAAADGRRDTLRRIMVSLFAELGQEHAPTLRYRRRLAAVLF